MQYSLEQILHLLARKMGNKSPEFTAHTLVIKVGTNHGSDLLPGTALVITAMLQKLYILSIWLEISGAASGLIIPPPQMGVRDTPRCINRSLFDVGWWLIDRLPTIFTGIQTSATWYTPADVECWNSVLGLQLLFMRFFVVRILQTNLKIFHCNLLSYAVFVFPFRYPIQLPHTISTSIFALSAYISSSTRQVGAVSELLLMRLGSVFFTVDNANWKSTHVAAVHLRMRHFSWQIHESVTWVRRVENCITSCREKTSPTPD